MIKKMLADPAWTGMGVVVSILALLFTFIGIEESSGSNKVTTSEINIEHMESEKTQVGNNNTMNIEEK